MSTLSLQQQQLINNSIQLIQSAFERYPADNIAISFSGAEDVILIDLMSQLQQRCEVFSLDTGRLHPQTYRFIETVRNHYDLPSNRHARFQRRRGTRAAKRPLQFSQ